VNTEFRVAPRMDGTPHGKTTHIFSVDVEEHFHVVALEPFVDRSTWDAQESRVERNVDILLGLLDDHKCSATFFVLGWVAERKPQVVERIAACGHEVASHGWSHRRVTHLTPQDFRQELRASKALLEDLCNKPVLGFRAPSFSIIPGMEWAFDALLDEGYLYDSSLFPIRRRGYGYPSAPPLAHQIERPEGILLELPLMTTQWRSRRIPAAGGAYFRHLPYALTQRALREHSRHALPGMFYIHPWEIDPDQPVLTRSPLTHLRHYGGLRSTLPRLRRLLTEFTFTSAAARLGIVPDRRLQHDGVPATTS